MGGWFIRLEQTVMRNAKIPEITRYTISAMAPVFFGFMPSHASAVEDRITFGSALKFSAGIASAFLIHEGSHAFVAWLTNTDMHWEIGTLNQPFSFLSFLPSEAGGGIRGMALFSHAQESSPPTRRLQHPENPAPVFFL
jgi:hypothetical protein